MQKLYSTHSLIKKHLSDEQFLKEMVELFIKHMPLMAAELQKAGSNNNLENIFFYAHKMKASIDLFEIKSLTHLIRTIEHEAEYAENTESLTKNIQQVIQTVLTCVEQLKADFEITA